ncbi:short chain dehydrogenase [Seminavis robusta]|uniref:Short chain dehydrogenase n=1 Tax=Seminavis robusta TaxID=568900 RepID=A0A9N8HCT1_9STRA|nr:short chain dehydrogenase [Seminavis robusta]|eukprot:Sro330_g118960.1 short chain dehydrogenase (479) ;mRNA; f:50540-51976
MTTSGNPSIPVDKALCEETYDLVRHHQTSSIVSNMLTFPSARKYVERLLQREAPIAAQQCYRQLAVVSGVTQSRGCTAYHVAEELVVAADMDVILVGPGNNSKSLLAAATDITEEFLKRKARAGSLVPTTEPPKIMCVRMNPNSLRSVSKAARDISKLAQKHHQGRVHALINLDGQVSEQYVTTEEGVDANVGRNYLAPRLLADLLLPLLRAAATDTFKPRLIQQASVGHCRGCHFDPHRLRKLPREGGAPEGTVVWNEYHWQYAVPSSEEGSTGLDQYYRSKFALMADTVALANEEPMLAAICVDPGVLSYATSPSGNTPSPRRASLSSRFVGLSHSQAARSALRAALDPAFNSIDTMQYLHCDGNAWSMAEPTLENPRTRQAYDMEEYAALVRDVADELCGQLVADKGCGWQQPQQSSDEEDVSESSFSESSADSSSSLDSSSAHAYNEWQCHSFHSSLLQTSLIPVGGGRPYAFQ